MKVKKGDVVSTPRGAGLVVRVGALFVKVLIFNKPFSFLKGAIKKI